jgi:serine/threonine-protein kinase
MTEDVAQREANRSGLLVSSTERTADDPAGLIVSQTPKSGFFLGRGGTVKLVVSKGPKPVKLPPVLMRAWTEAKTMLEQAQYAVTVERQYNETAPKEAVIATEPAGKAAPDTTVKLIVSDGPAPVTVPSVARLGYAAAAAKVQAAKLSPRRVDAFNDTVPKDQVIRTDPAAGTQAPRDSAVNIVVSKGPDIVIVPDLTKKTIDEATQIAQAAGLTVTVQGAYSPGKKVRAQDWPKGTPVKRGLLVTLFF